MMGCSGCNDTGGASYNRHYVNDRWQKSARRIDGGLRRVIRHRPITETMRRKGRPISRPRTTQRVLPLREGLDTESRPAGAHT